MDVTMATASAGGSAGLEPEEVLGFLDGGTKGEEKSTGTQQGQKETQGLETARYTYDPPGA